MDSRQRRTRERLHRTITGLASSQPIGRVTATEIAREAGVHRSTFYEWAQSPADLLRDALRLELDEIRERDLGDPTVDVAAAVRETTRAVLRHVAAYDDIYRRELSDDGGEAGLSGMLAEHFRASSALLLQQQRVAVPIDIPGVSPDLARDAALRYVAHGAVGALAAWLSVPGPRDEEAFLELFDRLLPEWWPRRQSV